LLGKSLETNVAIKITELNELLAGLKRPGVNIEDLLGRPEGSTDEIETGKLTKAQQRLLDSFNDLLASVDPFIDRMNTLAEAQATYAAGVEFATGATLSLEEVLRRVDREFLGVGNTVTDVAGKMKNLNAAYSLGRITTTELAIAQKELREELAGAAGELERSVSIFLSSRSTMTDAQLALDLARERGITLNLTEAEILRRTERDLVGAGNAASEYADKMKLLNIALMNTSISQEEFRQLAIAARVEFLASQRTMAAGAERAMLRIEEAYSNTAANVEDAFTTVFSNLEDRLVDFVETGIFSIREFLDIIRQEISRAFFREAIGEITGLFNDLLGNVIPGAGEDPETAASEALVAAKNAELLATQAVTAEQVILQPNLLTFNTLLTASGTTILPAFNTACVAATTCLNQLVLACQAASSSASSETGGGGGDFLGGFGGLITAGIGAFAGSGGGDFGSVNDGGSLGGQGTGNFDLANQGSFAHGGSFVVGDRNSRAIPNGGVDNRLVQFNAQSGEEVDIIPRGGRRRMGGTNVTINVTGAENADRFRRNQNGVTSRIAAAVSRTQQRNS
jgi:hypothetical protein